MKKKILVISAHPDDETLGCAGMVSHLVKYEGYTASIIFLSDGLSSRSKSSISIKKRKKHSLEACKIIGFKNIKFENFPDNSFDTIPLLKICKVLEKEISKIKPDIILTHNIDDLNVDHQLTSKATVTATRFYDLKKYKILSYEILSSTGLNFHNNNNMFNGDYFFDISKTLEIKIKAIMAYKDEVRNFPHPRSIEGIKILANFRGMQTNLDFAECFKVIKIKE
jgi:LmbE family N-acetylglucosaminyl deacetylase